MVYSEDLGQQLYSERKIHCCLNIYKRNLNGLNKPPKYNLNDIEIKEGRKGDEKRKAIISKEKFNYDIAICAWGSSLGKEIDYIGQYAQEFYIKIKNEKYKKEVIELIKSTTWQDVFNMTATPKLQLWKVYKYIKEQIPQIS